VWRGCHIIGLVGEEGAQKLAEIADKHEDDPYLWSFENVEEEIARVTALYSGWSRARLYVDGYFFGGGRDGCSFAVQ